MDAEIFPFCPFFFPPPPSLRKGWFPPCCSRMLQAAGALLAGHSELGQTPGARWGGLALCPRGRDGSELVVPASAPGEGISMLFHNSFLEASWFLENPWQAGLAAWLGL